MEKLQPKPAVSRDFVSRDLESFDPSDLLRPSVLAAVSELPEQRRLLYLAQADAAQKSGRSKTE